MRRRVGREKYIELLTGRSGVVRGSQADGQPGEVGCGVVSGRAEIEREVYTVRADSSKVIRISYS